MTLKVKNERVTKKKKRFHHVNRRNYHVKGEKTKIKKLHFMIYNYIIFI